MFVPLSVDFIVNLLRHFDSLPAFCRLFYVLFTKIFVFKNR